MIRIVHLYPSQLNIYGDQGNVTALKCRCEWRRIPVSVSYVQLGDAFSFKPGDILFIGGGQDKGQLRIAKDLKKRGATVKQSIEAGMPALAICGGYQLFGHFFRSSEGITLPGINVFDAKTIASERRMIGNVVLESKHFGTLVGFENHSGQTTLAGTQSELGVVTTGYGNNGEDGGEGAVTHNAIGTYLHGSFLPKNPKVADFLIRAALAQLGQSQTLMKLDDRLEQEAATFAKKLSQ